MILCLILTVDVASCCTPLLFDFPAAWNCEGLRLPLPGCLNTAAEVKDVDGRTNTSTSWLQGAGGAVLKCLSWEGGVNIIKTCQVQMMLNKDVGESLNASCQPGSGSKAK